MTTPTKKPPVKPPVASGAAPSSARRVPLVALLIGAVLALGLIVVLVSRGGDDDAADEAGGSASSESAESADTSAVPVIEFGTPTITGSALAEFPRTGADPAVGQVAPTVAGQSPAGQTVGIEPGSPRLIVFLAHWCPHCNKEADALRAEIDGGLDPAGIDIVLTGSAPDRENWPPSGWLASKGLLDLPTVADDSGSSISRAFGLTSFPFIVGVDAQGVVQFRAAGEQATGYFAEALGRLRA